MSRYDGKPFLKLLDCYVLSCIGHLDDKEEDALNLMAPRLSSLFGIRGSWFDIVSTRMEFPKEFPKIIQEIWKRGKENARRQGMSVDPGEFARQFVDTNFPNQ